MRPPPAARPSGLLHTRAFASTPARSRGDYLVAVEITPILYVKLENRPGTLERATRTLKERKLNIEGVSLETAGETGFLRVLAPKPREALDALRSQGIEAHESHTVLVGLPNKPGELHRASAELAAAGLNVEAVFSTADGRLAIRTNDNDRAAQVLRKL